MNRGARWLSWIVRPVPAGIVVAMVSLACAAAVTIANDFPPPLEHDEYSYLLGADTFLHGQLTNPPHPLWRHFDTFHVLQQPTYASKYPPANALVIATGWKLFGRPIAGVWLGFMFMCVAICWMLQAWLGRGWGFAVALAFAPYAALSYWSYSFWGGAVAAGAGALTLGAIRRIIATRSVLAATIPALALGAGLVLLANSRPYEGAILALAVLAVLAHWLWHDHENSLRWKLRAVVAPIAAVGTAGLICMGTYNNAVTGNWHTLPYTVYQQARGGAPLFLWQPPATRAPAADPTLQAYMHWEDSTYQAAKSFGGRVDFIESFVTEFVEIAIPAALLLPFLLIPFGMKDRWNRFAVVTIAASVFGMGLCAYFLPHYAAPIVGLLLALYGGSLRWLATLTIAARPVGRWIAIVVVVAWFGMGSRQIVRSLASHASQSADSDLLLKWPRQRQLIADTLAAHNTRNVIVVRYGAEHGSGNEWVYNAANIDASPVVWARDLGKAGNKPLLDYYHDRSVWLVEVNDDSGPYTVRPYPPVTP